MTDAEEPSGLRVEAVFNFTESGETEVVSMFFGMRPAILITPHEDGGDMVLQVKAVDIKPKHLVRTLRLIADAVERAHKKAKEERKQARAAERAAQKDKLEVIDGSLEDSPEDDG